MISFGPIPSRRLGKSLGINNIVPPKVCSYNCVYCQVGKTVNQEIRRKVFFDPETIFNDVRHHLKKIGKKNYPNYLTFVSNGEPTLDINLGKAIKMVKHFGIPVAIITNASLIGEKSVRDDLLMADWVSLKIDAADSDTWHRVNQPAPGQDFNSIIENMVLFADSYSGLLRTETMLIEGINDSVENIRRLSEIIKRINPGKAYLAIPTRPPSVKSVRPPDIEILNIAWNIYNDMNISTELLTGFEGIVTGFTGNIYEDILNMTAVHPLREDSLLNLLHNNNSDLKVVKSLISQRLLRSTTYNGNRYYIREYHINI
jgi:wyosine [tRNA(Phe)-imidazoG37] synthetase (radical SAM superfamily)